MTLSGCRVRRPQDAHGSWRLAVDARASDDQKDIPSAWQSTSGERGLRSIGTWVTLRLSTKTVTGTPNTSGLSYGTHHMIGYNILPVRRPLAAHMRQGWSLADDISLPCTPSRGQVSKLSFQQAGCGYMLHLSCRGRQRKEMRWPRSSPLLVCCRAITSSKHPISYNEDSFSLLHALVTPQG